jgi:hypothetical protein
LVNGFAAEEFADRAADERHPGRAADEDDAVDRGLVDLGVANDLAHRGDRAVDERPGDRFELAALDRLSHLRAGDIAAKDAALVARERFLDGARGDRRGTAIAGALRAGTGAGERPVGERGVDVVAAERRVAARGDDLEDAAGHSQQRDVEGAAAEVVDGVQALARVVEAVGDRCRGRLADQAQDVQAGELGGILRGLALGVVEVGRDGDDRAIELGVERVLGALTQGRQDLGRDLDRRLDSRLPCAGAPSPRPSRRSRRPTGPRSTRRRGRGPSAASPRRPCWWGRSPRPASASRPTRVVPSAR